MVALLFRLPGLARRPMHTDEAVQAVKSGGLLEGKGWRYDPEDYHGPTLPYVSLPSMWLAPGNDFAGTSELTFRVVPVLFGAGLILLSWLVADGLGRRAALVAAAVCAVSPAMVFYSRYYIHEMLLVFFTLGAIAAGWRYARTNSTGWAVLAGAFLGLMHATKETSVIAFFAMGVGFSLTVLWSRWIDGVDLVPAIRPLLRAKALVAAAGAAFAVSFLLYSSFFTDMRGPLDSALAYLASLRRGTGGGVHDHPWHYYLRTLIYSKAGTGPWWSEGLVVALSVVGASAALKRKSASGKGGSALFALPGDASVTLARFLAFYTLVMVVVYSAIPYKTPWCMLGFLHGMILLAGVGAVVIARGTGRVAQCFGEGPRTFTRRLIRKGGVPAAVVLLGAAGLHLAWQAQRSSHDPTFFAHRRNPYVYAHTVPDLVRLAERVEDIAKVSPEGSGLLVRVIAPEAWPLPWYLRGFPNVRYSTEPPPGFDADAPVLITSPAYAERIAPKLKSEYHVDHYGLRPTVVLLLYVRQDLWDTFIEKRAGDG